MTKAEEELEITKFNYKCIKKLNEYNASIVGMMETKEANKELTKENHKLIVESCILALLWLVSSIIVLVG